MVSPVLGLWEQEAPPGLFLIELEMGKSVTMAPREVQSHHSSCFIRAVKAAGTRPSHTIRDLGSEVNSLHSTITTSAEAPTGLLAPVSQQAGAVAGRSQAKYRAMFGIPEVPRDEAPRKFTV